MLRGKFGDSDVVQEALLRAYKDFPNFQGETPEQFYTWIAQIASNVRVDLSRKYCQTASRNVAVEAPLHEVMPDARSDRTEPVLDALVRREETQGFARLLDQLP